jgi:hypothetical protein
MLTVAAGCLLVLAAKVMKLWHDPASPALRAQCLVLGALAASIGVQPFVAAIDRLTGIQKVGGFAGELAVTIAAGAGQVFLIGVSHPAEDGLLRSRRSYRLLGAVLVVLVVVFVLGAPDPYTAHGETHSIFGHLSLIPWSYLYLYPYYLYLGGTLVALIRMCIRYATLTDDRFLRIGLRTLTAGCIVGIGYTLISLVALSLQEYRVNVDGWKTAVTTPLYLATDALVLLGLAIPPLARTIAAGRTWIRNRRAHRDLQPLWLALYRVHPDIALLPPTDNGGHRDTKNRDTKNTNDLALRLYRQVIEIRDGQLALRPYLDLRATRIATELGQRAGLRDHQISVVSEAATLAAAIFAKENDRPPSTAYRQASVPHGGTDLRTEIVWLRQVSRALTNSPIVSHTLRMLAGAAD